MLDLKKFKIESIALIVLAIFFIASRIFILDSDIPSWDKTNYSPVDEFYYTTQAFEIVEGIHSPDGKLLTPQSSAYNILEQLATAGSLYLLGDNYYGLRIPSVIAGLIVLICLYQIVLKRFGVNYAITFSLLLILEQSFTLATKIAEPTIFRMAAASILLLFFTSHEFTNRNHIRAIGFATCFAWLFIYPTNAFLGLFGLIIVATSNPNNITKSITNYFIGFILCAIFYLLSYHFLGNTVSDLTATVSIFSGRVTPGVDTGFLKQTIIKLASITKANFFELHPSFLIAFTASSIFITALFLKRNKLLTRTDKIILIFTICFLLQCAFINDYPKRKLVFILPACIYLCMLAANLLLRKTPAELSAKLSITATIVSIVLLSIPTFNNIYKNPTYDYKNSMKKLSFLDNERIIGGWGYGFRLYNNYKPYLNKYAIIYTNPERYYHLLSEAGKLGNAKFTLEHDSDQIEKEMNNIGFYKDKLAFKSNDATYPDMYIYKYSEKK